MLLHAENVRSHVNPDAPEVDSQHLDLALALSCKDQYPTHQPSNTEVMELLAERINAVALPTSVSEVESVRLPETNGLITSLNYQVSVERKR